MADIWSSLPSAAPLVERTDAFSSREQAPRRRRLIPIRPQPWWRGMASSNAGPPST